MAQSVLSSPKTPARYQPLDIGSTFLEATYRADLRTTPPDVFEDISRTDWNQLDWSKTGRPFRVENYSRRRKRWEKEHEREMPVPVQWKHFNRCFHELFVADSAVQSPMKLRQSIRRLGSLDLPGARDSLAELIRLKVWNHVHRIEDAVWDPRGKRALFEGLDVHKPRILFLGAADGYEAMQLSAMYPGGEAVLVDYDDFCRTDRYGAFPDAYPFLGENPSAGAPRVWRKGEMQIDFEVEDIRNLRYGQEFDIVLSVGLIEHFPDDHKGTVFEFHRRFLKPGGYAIMTTPRRQLRSRAFYLLMGELMNYGYRELMDARQLGLYAYENGFDVLRCGYIKAHNGVVARTR